MKLRLDSDCNWERGLLCVEGEMDGGDTLHTHWLL